MTFPKKYYKMINLLRACCLTVSDFHDYCYDERSVVQLYELIDKAFAPEILSDCNSNNKIQSDFDISDSLEQIPETTQDESNFIKVLKTIYDQHKNTTPTNKAEVDSIAFLYKTEIFNAICFRKKFFEKTIEDLSISNYKWDMFYEECQSNYMMEHNPEHNDIVVQISRKSINTNFLLILDKYVYLCYNIKG